MTIAAVDFTGVYDDHVARLHGFFVYALGSRTDAEDLTQQAFERALRGWELYDAARGPALTWLLAIARTDTRTRLLMTTPGVGVIVALTFTCAIDNPSRFKSSKAVGAYFGMTPTRYQSGETDYSGRISKHGDGSVRAVLYESAHLILTRPLKGCTALKSWAMRLALRAGMRKAKVALARKLAVVLHRMLADDTEFLADKAATAAA